MSGVEVLVILAAALVLFLFLGIQVAFALLIVGTIALTSLLVPAQGGAIPSLFWNAVNSYTLTAVPLFVLMAEVLSAGGVSKRVYNSLEIWLGGVPGGAASANIVAGAVLAAISGSSTANAAALGSIAGREMVERGYSKKLTFGSIAAAGSLGILIPPSIAFIIYGTLAGVSVAQLFIAGIIPGLLLMALFLVTILVWGMVNPRSVPPHSGGSWRERALAAWWLLPPVALIAIVLGSLYAGIVTASEAGVLGVLGALLITKLIGELSLGALQKAVEATIGTTSMIVFIIAAASLVTYVVGYVGTASMLSAGLRYLQLSPTSVLVLIAVLYMILGCFVESVSLIILTVPILTPVMSAYGVDLLWFGVFLVLWIEFGLLTPPVGLNLYVLQGVRAGQTFGDIVLGSLPFLAAYVVAAILIMMFPVLVTWLPGLMKAR